jgi:hypothetical protein
VEAEEDRYAGWALNSPQSRDAVTLTSIADWKARLAFPGTAVAVGVAAFLIGYRSPKAPAGAAVAVPVNVAPSAGADASTVDPEAADPRSATRRDGLRVEGFAKIGFAETEELLTTASPEQRQQWARELAELPEQPLKAVAYVAFYTAWLNLEPEEALRSLRAFPDLLMRSRVFAGLPPMPAVLPQLVEIISGFSEAERSRLLPPFLSDLAETNPTAAARFIDSHPRLVSSTEAASLMSTWTGDDVEAARKWLEASRFSSDANVLRSFVKSWLLKDPSAAKQYVVTNQHNDALQPAAASVVSHLVTRSPEEAREFITSFDRERASSVTSSFVSSVEESQLADVAAWVSTLPNPVRDDALLLALTRWNYANPREALAWTRAKPAAEREPFVIQMVNASAEAQSFGRRPVSPELVSLTYDVGDAQKRDQALSTLVRSFRAENGDVATQIRSLGLPASQTKHLLALRAALGDDVEAPHDH